MKELEKDEIIKIFDKLIGSDNVCAYCLERSICDYKNYKICIDCVREKKLITINCQKPLLLKKVDLKKYLIFDDHYEDFCICKARDGMTFVTDFAVPAENKEWHLYRFPGKNIYKKYTDNVIIFDLSRPTHLKLFCKNTRFVMAKNLTTWNFNHKYHDIRGAVLTYKTNKTERSVERIYKIIHTAELVFKCYRVPKFVRIMIIEFYLKA